MAALLLGGCTVGPDYTPPKWMSPVSWFSTGAPDGAARARPISVAVTAPVDPRWWSAFGDPELTSLVERVAAANFDVRVATIRLAESRAQRGVTAADQYPTANGNASYSRERLSQKGAISLLSGGSGGSSASSDPNSMFNGAGGTVGAIPSSVSGGTKIPPFNLFQYGFDTSWELDLWGRVRRSIESADASVVENEQMRRNALLSAIAEVARDYIELRGTQAQIAIQRDNLRTAQQSLQLTQDRFRGGLTTELDVNTASAQVRTTAARLPQLEQQEAASINALSFLLGLQPAALRDELASAKPVPPVPPQVPVGLPSELAHRRPDILQAEAQLHAATADIGVAQASFYPTVTLSGSFSIQALRTKNLSNWDARQFGFGPSITIPIFEGGRLKAQLELRRAQQQEAALTYQRTVLNAWHEVDNALTAYDAEQRRLRDLGQAVNDNRRALSLAQARYTQGLIDFLQVLDAERNLLAAQQQLTESTTTVSTNLVALYKALGGGWENDFPPAAPPALRQASVQ
jgi:NodT family efflux transporter outer membrane factor (OMF) lipoprotein